MGADQTRGLLCIHRIYMRATGPSVCTVARRHSQSLTEILCRRFEKMNSIDFTHYGKWALGRGAERIEPTVSVNRIRRLL